MARPLSLTHTRGNGWRWKMISDFGDERRGAHCSYILTLFELKWTQRSTMRSTGASCRSGGLSPRPRWPLRPIRGTRSSMTARLRRARPARSWRRPPQYPRRAHHSPNTSATHPKRHSKSGARAILLLARANARARRDTCTACGRCTPRAHQATPTDTHTRMVRHSHGATNAHDATP